MSRTLLRMSETAPTEPTWPYEEFAAFLDDVLRAAGVRETRRTGRPSLAEFESRTGLSGSQLNRWRNGSWRPSPDSLRQIAITFADDADVPLDHLYANLMRAAGFSAQPVEASPALESDPGGDPIAAIKRFYTASIGEDREWIRGKLVDLQEQIEMRKALSRQSKRGS